MKLEEKTIEEVKKEVIAGMDKLFREQRFGYVQANIGNGEITIQDLGSKKYKIKK